MIHAALSYSSFYTEAGTSLYTTYTYVVQSKVNNKVMCQMSMKLLAMFYQNLPRTLDKIVAKHNPVKSDVKP